MVTGIAYPITAHWCWGPSGWLGDHGFRDYAGAGVVHLSGGVIALIGIDQATFTQCGNFRIFISLRFHVKSILRILEVQNLPL